MQLTIDSTQPLDDVLRVVGALYDVKLEVRTNGAAAANGNSATPARPGRSSSGRASTSSRPTRRAARKRSSRVSPSEVRSWAVKNGFEVSARGRIPASVLSAYANAHH